MALSGGYTGPKEVKYLFIDGGCLRAILDQMASTYADGVALDLDYSKLTAGYSKVFYYDALPGRKRGEDNSTYSVRIAPQQQLLDRLNSLDRFHVYEGDVRRSAARRGPEQKKIDVMVAVDMLTHSFRRNMHEATLLTGYLDFKPLIDALVLEGMFVTLWYPASETTKELIAAADRSRPLNIVEIYNSLAEPRSLEVPKAYNEPSKGEYAPILMKWSIDIGEVTLMKDASNFVVAVPDSRNRDRMTYYEYSDLAILRAYLSEMAGLVLPEIPEN